MTLFQLEQELRNSSGNAVVDQKLTSIETRCGLAYVGALLLTLAAENAKLREQSAAAQDMLVETAIDAGQLHARIEAVQTERDTWWAERLRPQLSADGRGGQATR